MATKQAEHTNVAPVIAQPDFAKMTPEQFAEWRASLDETLRQAAEFEKKNQQALQEKAFSEIKTVLDKHFKTVGSAEGLTKWLSEQKYIAELKGAQGRRAMAEGDILLSYEYTPEGGSRSVTLKLDALSKMPANKAQNSYKQIMKLRGREWESIKKHFTPKFFEFAKTDEGKKWIKTFFPNIQEALNAEE